MKNINISRHLTLTLAFLLTSVVSAHDVPISFERYSDRVLIVKGGKVYTDQVAVIASDRGLIVIDSGKSPTLTKEYREIIERELGRNDFVYVINTHYHFDHTSGNQVFPEAEIIAHEMSPEGMRRFDADRVEFVQSRRQGMMKRWEEQLADAEPGSQQALRLIDILTTGRVMLDDYEKNFILTLPDITFNDRLSLDMGNLTLELVYFGEGKHAGDDILILCPEEKILFTGDLFGNNSFRLARRPEADIPRWIDVLNSVLDRDVDWVYDCHNGRMTGAFLRLWRDYLVDLWGIVNTAKNQDQDYQSVSDQFSYGPRFSYLEKTGANPDDFVGVHADNLYALWLNANNLPSVSFIIRRTFVDAGVDSAIQKYRELRADTKTPYLFRETDLNEDGYMLMRQGQVKDAIKIFDLNAEYFPDSWNVWDSLGEAYLADGNNEMAKSCYEKSVSINPENTNGREVLDRLKN